MTSKPSFPSSLVDEIEWVTTGCFKHSNGINGIVEKTEGLREKPRKLSIH
jgi:hypothetical protein